MYELVVMEAREDDDFWRGNGVLYGLRTLVHFSHFGSRRDGVVESGRVRTVRVRSTSKGRQGGRGLGWNLSETL